MKLLLKNLLFTVLVPGTVAVYVPLLIARGHAPVSGIASWPAWPCFALGTALYASCVRGFAGHGRGTPAPIDPPKRLVVRGPYRASRNPMYVGVLGVILGWATLFRLGALFLYAAAVATAFHLTVVFYEEPALRRAFGDEYRDYCARVGRWLPKLRRARGE